MSNGRITAGVKNHPPVARSGRSPASPVVPSITVPGSPVSYWKSLGPQQPRIPAQDDAPKAPPSMPGPRLSRVMAFIEENISVDLYISTLASVAGMSSFYFCRSFKQSTGITPHQFVLARRMELAKHLLRHERIPLMEVAHKVGFTDQSQFTRVFRKIVGTTPSQFRRSVE